LGGAQTKKNRPAGRFFKEKLITSKQPEQRQQPMQPKRLPKQPKQQPKRQQQRPKQQQRPEQQRQQPEQPERPELQRPVPEQPERRLLSCCKQPEQQPAGKRSAGIFSWVFLNLIQVKYCFGAMNNYR
jgi:hypothetical protein